MVAETDNRGLVRAYMLIDVMPVAEGAGEGGIQDVNLSQRDGIPKLIITTGG